MKTLKLSLTFFLMLFTSLVAQSVTNLRLKQHYGRDITEAAVVGIAQDPFTNNIVFNADRHIGMIDLEGNHLGNWEIDAFSLNTVFTQDSIFVISNSGIDDAKRPGTEWGINKIFSYELYLKFNWFYSGIRHNNTFWMCSGTSSRITSKMGGLFEVNLQYTILDSFTITDGRFPANQALCCLLDSTRNQLWIGTDLGLIVFNFNTKASKKVIEDSYCKSIAWSYDKTEILTVVEYDQEYSNTPTFFKVNPNDYSFSIESGNEVDLYLCHDILEDRHNNYFFANGYSSAKELGLNEKPLIILSRGQWFKLNKDFEVIPYQQFIPLEVHPIGGLFDLTIDKDGNIWAGAYNGIYVFDFGDSAVEEVTIDSQPKDFALHQNYPNPFNPETNIEFSLPRFQHVNLTVFDVNGRVVETLIINEIKNPGTHKIIWTPDVNLSSGIYIIRLITEQGVKIVKASYVK